MPLIKPPHPDSSLDPFIDGAGILSSERGEEGIVFTTRWQFWSPFSPLRRQWWIWYVVVWNDGTRERPVEDYPPFVAVREMESGHLMVDSRDQVRDGRYDVRWLDPEAASEARQKWSITSDSF